MNFASALWLLSLPSSVPLAGLCRRTHDGNSVEEKLIYSWWILHVFNSSLNILVNDKKESKCCVASRFNQFYVNYSSNFWYNNALISFTVFSITYYDSRVTFHSIVHLCTPALCYRSTGNCYWHSEILWQPHQLLGSHKILYHLKCYATQDKTLNEAIEFLGGGNIIILLIILYCV